MAHDHDEFLSDRARQLLRVLVESYIRDGQPVGSRTLSRDSGLSLSSATIRNVMADLEELGFVSSPHTSAGRVPTPKGYRFFIDTLLKVQPLEASHPRFGTPGSATMDGTTLFVIANQQKDNYDRFGLLRSKDKLEGTKILKINANPPPADPSGLGPVKFEEE